MIPAILALAAALEAQPQIGASRLVLASATDPRGRALVDVGADDFVVEERGATRDILSVRLADYPVIVLIDEGAEAGDFALMRQAAVHFIERLGADRPVVAGVFGGAPKLLATFEDDRKSVLERVNALSPAPADGSRLLAGVALASQALHATGSLFSAVVALSAASRGEAREESDADQAVGPIVGSGAIVHVVRNEAAPGGPARRALRSIVDQTRGEYTTIYAAASYQAALDRLADRLSSELLIEYLVPPGSKPADVKVGIRVLGARVRGLGVAPR